MWETRAEPFSAGTHYSLRWSETGTSLTYSEAIYLWQRDAKFCSYFVALLQSSAFQAFRWETPPVTLGSVHRRFEFVLLNSSTLERPADRSAFAAQFEINKPAVEFDNLGGDATLIVPTLKESTVKYGHLAAFSRTASQEQNCALWHCVGQAMNRRISMKPVWLSTAGAGVAWLHVRLDDRPKYYGYSFYRKYDPREVL